VEDWLQFKVFEDFVAWVKKFGRNSFHFKATNSAFSGLGNFFHHFFPHQPIDRKDPSVNTCLGVLTYRSLTLDPARFYAKPVKILRQGDVIKVNAKDTFPSLAAGGIPSHWIILAKRAPLIMTRSV
jgi:hypothetical protein